MSLALFLSVIRRPRLISFESAKRKYTKYTVGPVHFWREQQKMEEAAGISHTADKIMVPWRFCDLCMIGIGPEHEHQHVYLYPVYREQVGPRGERKRTVVADMFCICEGCASWKERDLPEWLCVLGPWAWETNALIKEEIEEVCPIDQSDGKLRAVLRTRALDYIEACGWYIVYIMAFTFNISLDYFFQIIPSIIAESEEGAQDVPVTQQVHYTAQAQKKGGIREGRDPGIFSRKRA